MLQSNCFCDLNQGEYLTIATLKVETYMKLALSQLQKAKRWMWKGWNFCASVFYITQNPSTFNPLCQRSPTLSSETLY